ncbi:MAG: hypothetical protein EOP07_13595, partial [Proteobacteria bacterium]
MKLSQHILLGLLASLTLRANAQSNVATGLEIAAAASDSSEEGDDWGAPAAVKGSKKPVTAQGQPVSAGEAAQPAAVPAPPSDAEAVPNKDEEDFDETVEAKPAMPLKKPIPKKVAPKVSPVDAEVKASVPAATPAASAPAAVPPQGSVIAEPAVEAIPTPAVKAPVVKNPVKPAAPVQAPAAPSNGAAQQTAPKQVP